MFGSPILDVAIGMAFVYLLLSLIVSAMQEMLASFVQARAANLERGLRSLFSGDQIPIEGELESFVDLIYGHGLVRGLYQDPASDFKDVLGNLAVQTNKLQKLLVRIKWYLRYFLGLTLPGQTAKTVNLLFPSYIPSRTFALALIDILKTGAQAAGQAGVGDAAVAAAAGEVQGGAGAVQNAEGAVQNLAANAAAVGAQAQAAVEQAQVAAAQAQSWIEQLETELGKILNGPDGKNKAVQALLALVRDAASQDAGGQAARLQSNIENWYNDAMDRVSGWYKHYAQKVLIVIGFALAVGLNVDSIRVARMLWLDKDARATITAAASDYMGKHPQLDSAQTADKPGSPAELAGNVRIAYQTFDGISKQSLLPVGWKRNPATYLAQWNDAAMQKKFVVSLMGWIITAIALSLGAPFWFDLLNKFMVVRGTVKPQEKSATEKSKDN